MSSHMTEDTKLISYIFESQIPPYLNDTQLFIIHFPNIGISKQTKIFIGLLDKDFFRNM